MTFSLITATLGRVEEIRLLLKSLVLQTYKDFELYIVDQNSHHLVEDIVKEFKDALVIHYIRNDNKGLSLNRNIALKKASGEIFGFPDDDCYYAKDTLEHVYKAFQENKESLFIATSTYDTVTKKQQRTFLTKKIYKKDVFQACISYNIFVRKNSILFDERLGVGTYFSSGEETDYLYSLIHDSHIKYGIFCIPAKVFHPAVLSDSYDKIYKYSLGFAALQKKDWLVRNNRQALSVYAYYLLRAFCGMLLIRHFRKHWSSFAGKIVGFIKFRID